MGNKLSKIHDMMAKFFEKHDKVAEELKLIREQMEVMNKVLVSLQDKVQPKK